MKRISHRAAAIALVLALSVGSTAAAATPARERDPRDGGDVIVRVIKKIRKFFGIAPTDDLPGPIWPKP